MGLKLHVKEPTAEHAYTAILLHGRDSTAEEFASELFEGQTSDGRTLTDIFPGVKWVFPDSGKLKSARFGCEIPQWFDMWSVEHPQERTDLQTPGLRQNIPLILEVINREKEIIAPRKIFLAGISQGFAILTHLLFSLESRYAGIIGFCGWLPFESSVSEISASHSPLISQSKFVRLREIVGKIDAPTRCSDLSTPLLLAHSEDDHVVPIENGKHLKRALKGLGMTVKWQGYAKGGHWVNEPQGMDDLVGFIAKRMDHKVWKTWLSALQIVR